MQTHFRANVRQRAVTSIAVTAALIVLAVSLACITLVGLWLAAPAGTATISSSDREVGGVKPDFSGLPLYFEPNVEQMDAAGLFMTHSSGGNLYFTRSGVVLSLPVSVQGSSEESKDLPSPRAGLASMERPTSTIYKTVHMDFVGASPVAEVASEDVTVAKVNYFIGNDPVQWRSSVPTYGGITYKDIMTLAGHHQG